MDEESYYLNNNIIEMPAIDYNPVDSIGVEYFRFLQSHPDRIAQYIVDNDEVDTYGALLKRCVRTALKIQSKNLKPNDIICMCTYNHKNSCVPWIASTFLGLKIASLDPSLSVDDTAHLLKQVKPAIIFLVPESIDLIEESLKCADIESRLVIFDGEYDHCYEQFNDYLEYYDDDDENNFEPVKINRDVTAVIFFSSGTTGLPKGICQNSYALLCQAYNFMKSGAITTVTLSNASLYWISSILLMTAVFMTGTTRVIWRKSNPTEIWSLIEKYRISTMILAPIEAMEMLKVGRPDNLDTSSLLVLYAGGGILPTKQLLALRDLLPGTFVAQVYGLTEVAGAITLYNLNNVKDTLLLDRRPATCGRPVPGAHYKIVNLKDENIILGPNQEGELLIKTKFCMNGYYNNVDSSSCFDKDGWLRTGDIAYYDQDLCFYIVDRIKELLKYRSWHIQPIVIENVLIEHPAIKKAVVIGIPHEDDGDHPMAIVMLNSDYDDDDDVTAEEIQDFVAQRVSDRQRLRGGVRFVKSFPITPSAKIKKQLLKKMVLEGQI